MGNSSSGLTQDDFDELGNQTRFSQKELKHLYKRFRKLDRQRLGSLSQADLLAIPELAMNPLHTRILSIFEKNKDERVDFRSFVSCLDVLSKGTKEEKISVAFRIYDFDGDGYISINDFLAVLKMMVGKHLQDEPASHVAEKTIHQYDKDNDEKLSETEFEDAMEGTDIENQLTITVS